MLGYFRNREKLGYLVGSFLLVLVIFAFIVFYIPDFLGPGQGAAPGEVARVAGRPISSKEFLDSYRSMERMYRAQLGERYSPALLQQLGLRDQALQRLITQVALEVEAGRQGLSVTDEEVRRQILSDPSFQRNGQFIGRAAYLQLLAASSMTASDFEEQVRQRLLSEKLQRLVTDGVLVSPAEVEAQYRRRNEKAKLEYVFVARSDFEKELQPSDEEVSARFEKDKERYRLPVQRKIRYLAFGPERFTAAASVTDREIQRYYNENLQLYETGDQVQASHILFKIPGKLGEDEAAVRPAAEAVLREVQAGGDFAELAKKHSEDTSAEQGGDLGFFGRGDMVPEFESAAFSMAEGEVSDLVRTTYGFHIIKVTGRQTGFTRPLESVKDQIKSVLADRKAREAMARAVQAAEERLRRTGNLEALAQQYNLTTTDSPPFSRQEGLPLLGSPAEVRRLAFELKIGETSPSVSTPRGSVLFRVLEELPSRLPELEEVKARVRADLVRERATELSRARADELRAKLSAPSVKELAAAAKAAGVELKTAESFARTAPLPELGRSAALEQEAFRLEPGSLSPPIAGELGWVLVRVVERSGYSPERFAAERDSFTEQLVSERRLQVWNAFVQDLQQRLEIEIHRDALSGLS